MKQGPAAVLALCLVLFAAPAGALAEPRLALVIGNAAYEAEGRLTTPTHDARLMADTLRSLGFELYGDRAHVDLSEKAMRRLIHNFSEELGRRAKPVGLFFYSGHGVQVGRRNYMIPVDAEIQDQVDVESEGISIDGDVLGRMNLARTKINIIVLDACRNNPFEKRIKALGRTKGLSDMRPEQGSLIAFAAEPGEVAYESEGQYSHFTEVLADEMKTPGIGIVNMFRRVRVAVNRKTNGKQTPVARDILFEEFFFTPEAARVAAPPPTPAPVPPASQVPAHGDVFRDRLRGGGEGPEMVVVGPGSATIGSPDNEDGRDTDEGPVQTVTLRDAFAIGRHEVTVGEFKRFVSASGYRTEAESGDGCRIWTGSEWKYESGSSWRSPGFSQSDDHPVVCVSWNDATRFVDWLSEETGKRYRLPTETEWEYAARAGTVTARYWGNDSHDACAYANVADETAKKQFPDWTIHNCRDGHVYTAPVGSYSPNRYGLHDMMGNVWEWVRDCYQDSYRGLPLDGSPRITSDCGLRVVRGGSWSLEPRPVRSAPRGWNEPPLRDDYLGFRLAQDLK